MSIAVPGEDGGARRLLYQAAAVIFFGVGRRGALAAPEAEHFVPDEGQRQPGDLAQRLEHAPGRRRPPPR